MHRTHLHHTCLRWLVTAAVLAGGTALHAQAVQEAQAAVPHAQAGAPSRQAQDARFREAMRLHRAGHWSAAYGRFVALADEGHVPASRVALAMLDNGHKVYGKEWSAAPSQVAAWKHAVNASEATKTAHR